MISGDLSMSKRRTICISVALTLGMITFTASAMAQVAAPSHPQPQPHRVPEIDAGSVGSALGLLGFGTIMLLEGRRRRLSRI
jgi:hypothetical protein